MRELLIIKSLETLSTASSVYDFVHAQPEPKIFYKSFLELDGTNLLSMLAFDSKSIDFLLNKDKSQYFNEKFPIIYKNKMAKKNNSTKFCYRSAIDQAMKSNQHFALDAMINYIVTYQNNYISSFLFAKNFMKLIELGVEVSPLLLDESHIFRYSFDFDQWISTHTNDQRYLKPYNDSLFNLRNKYSEVFAGPEFEPINE